MAWSTVPIMRRHATRPRRLAIGAMTAALAAAVVAFVYTMAAAVPHHTSNLLRDWLADGLFTAAGILYVSWAAISNRSLVVGLLGSTEFLLLTPICFLLFRYPVRLPAIPGLLLALILFGLFVYPWTRVDRIRRAVARHTGLS